MNYNLYQIWCISKL